MSEQTEKCAHPPCHCPARRDSDYCGEYCLRAEVETETGCLCGHPSCQTTHTATTIRACHTAPAE